VKSKVNSNKAKQIRIEKKRKKLEGMGLSAEEVFKKMKEKKRYPIVKTIEHFIDAGEKEDTLLNLKVSDYFY